MNNRFRIIMAATIVCLLAFPVFAVCSEGTDDVCAINSDQTVSIDIDGTFDSNKTELAKLGITDSSKWSTTQSGNKQLEFDNVNFVTTKDIALYLHGSSTDTFVLEFTGENSITSGSDWSDSNHSSRAIYAKMDNGNDIKIYIGGKGSLFVGNNITATDTMSAYGIKVEGYLGIYGINRLTAIGSSFTHTCYGTSMETSATIESVGIYARTQVDIQSGYEIVAMGGDVEVVFIRDTRVEHLTINSYGIGAPRFNSIDSHVVAIGGDVNFKTKWDGVASTYIKSSSFGINVMKRDGIVTYSQISRGKVTAISGNVEGKLDNAVSKGMALRCDEGQGILISHATIKSISSTARSSSLTMTAGIELYNNATINNTLIEAYGAPSKGETKHYALGIHTAGTDLTFNHSIIVSESAGTGICLMNARGQYGTLNINDSEVTSHGDNKAFNVQSDKITASTGWKYFRSVSVDGKKTVLTDVTKIAEAGKTVEIGYHNDFIIMDRDGTIHFHLQTDMTEMTMPEMDDTRFLYFTVNGAVVSPGDTIYLDGLTYIRVVYTDCEGELPSEHVVPAVAVVVALISLSLMFMIRKP